MREVGSPHSIASLVEMFLIEGLYGYRTIGLNSQYAATILIAKNGSGKTTLLGVLDSFLNKQYSRLQNLDFERIRCKLRGHDDELVLTPADIASLSQLPPTSELLRVAVRYGLEPQILMDFIDNDFIYLRKIGELAENQVFDKIYKGASYNVREATKVCERIIESLRGRNDNIDTISKVIDSVLAGIEIVYLPTYRRIELPLNKEGPEVNPRTGRKRGIHSRLGLSGRSHFGADIQFGISDISEKLFSLNQEILIKSNQGYREASANIINELINGVFDKGIDVVQSRPSKEALTLFFSRLSEKRVAFPFGEDVVIPDIDRIYGGVTDIPSESNKFLTYYLSKLNTVIETTQDIERVVEEFIKNCNSYLSLEDESASIPDVPMRPRKLVEDGKVLTLDRRNLSVSVKSIVSNKTIHLDALSSGEKQMISLFARLYLYSGRKIILIDEPELSLSLDWQKRILLDVIKAPNCAQVIAITHSPFVFDNELEPFAKALHTRINMDAVEHVGNQEGDEAYE